jgi:RimJ/RimL family protein N-acetyltransferase
MPEFVFKTPRLVARRLEHGDIEALLSVYGDPQVVRWVGDRKPLDRGLCEKWVEVTHRNYATRGYGMFTLVEQESGAVVGFCGLVHPGAQPEAEVKYALHRNCWGKGYATEAVCALLAYGASQLSLNEVIATVAPGNKASQSVLLKAGMQRGEVRRNEDGSFTQLFAWRRRAAEPRNAP